MVENTQTYESDPKDFLKALDSIDALEELPEGTYTFNGRLKSEVNLGDKFNEAGTFEVTVRKASDDNGITNCADSITGDQYAKGETVLELKKGGSSCTMTADTFVNYMLEM